MTESEFWKRVDVRGPDECWPWKKAVVGDGYGVFREADKTVRAHRRALELSGATLFPNALACHTCDNPPCCNPAHLFLGTQNDNMQDCQQKGRTSRGDKHHWHKLTEKQVVEIRKIHATGMVSISELARNYHMSFYAIWAAITRKSWKHVI